MTLIPDIGRQSAHVFLDATSTWSDDEPDSVRGPRVQLALERLDEIGAVTATMGDADVLTVDASQLVGGALVLVHYLVDLAAEVGHVDRAQVIAQAREFLDSPATPAAP